MRKLWPHQRKAVNNLRNGNILVGGTGSGKGLTALGYLWEKELGGSLEPYSFPTIKKDIFIITTARKRDDLDWYGEAANIGLSHKTENNPLGISLTVDSWNNIKKYVGVSGAVFIFDEQRSTGKGAWAKTFIKIAKKNRWIILSATPGDQWTDYIPVFIANGFYKNRTQFLHEHVVFAPRVKYPKIVRYLGEAKLKGLRHRILVHMPVDRHTVQHKFNVHVDHPAEKIKEINKTEWNPFEDRPILNLPEHRSIVRTLINTHPSRAQAALEIHEKVKKLIIFYNFNPELELLRESFEAVADVYEYNGHKHDPVPEGDNWVYLVQYHSGNEAWECFSTNHMLFYSASYSYKQTIQSMGRIDRHNTHFTDLYYYFLKSDSWLDIAIFQAHSNKKNFNDSAFDPRESQMV